jgi:hypothetical protein
MFEKKKMDDLEYRATVHMGSISANLTNRISYWDIKKGNLHNTPLPIVRVLFNFYARLRTQQ